MTDANGPVIEIEGLRKVYRRRGKARMALDGLDLTVEPGQVHGFLGPNGSGKTTTLRALLGLVRADGGTMRIFGQPVPLALPSVIGGVGAVVESPQFFGNFTARRTLRLLATAGGIKRKRVDEVLETVGLRDRAKDRVKSYSLGMKQRLAVATALLKSPRVLILDEPANGLDPAGIREIRDLLRSLGASGMTVLLSSHILSEVQQICDHVSIISLGRRVVSGPVSEVLSQFDKGDVRVKVADLEGAAKVIGDSGLPVQRHGDHLVVSDLADPAWITETLAKRRMYVSELVPLVPDLENVFLRLTDTMPTPGVARQVDDAYRPNGPHIVPGMVSRDEVMPELLPDRPAAPAPIALPAGPTAPAAPPAADAEPAADAGSTPSVSEAVPAAGDEAGAAGDGAVPDTGGDAVPDAPGDAGPARTATVLESGEPATAAEAAPATGFAAPAPAAPPEATAPGTDADAPEAPEPDTSAATPGGDVPPPTDLPTADPPGGTPAAPTAPHGPEGETR